MNAKIVHFYESGQTKVKSSQQRSQESCSVVTDVSNAKVEAKMQENRHFLKFVNTIARISE